MKCTSSPARGCNFYAPTYYHTLKHPLHCLILFISSSFTDHSCLLFLFRSFYIPLPVASKISPSFLWLPAPFQFRPKYLAKVLMFRLFFSLTLMAQLHSIVQSKVHLAYICDAFQLYPISY